MQEFFSNAGFKSTSFGRQTNKKMKSLFRDDKKGQVFQALTGLGIGLAVLLITLAVVFLIMSNVGSNASVAGDPNATAAVTAITVAADTIPGWVPLVVIVVIGALIIGLVSRGFGGGR